MKRPGKFAKITNPLTERGWRVKQHKGRASLPPILAERYPWIPDDLRTFLCSIDDATSPDEKAWWVTWAELSCKSESAFSWNEWEKLSLSAAEGDNELQRSIRAFWDKHFPLLLSVKSGYAYIAIRSDLRIVAGEEPEFEETEDVANNFADFLQILANSNDRLNRWL